MSILAPVRSAELQLHLGHNGRWADTALSELPLVLVVAGLKAVDDTAAAETDDGDLSADQRTIRGLLLTTTAQTEPTEPNEALNFALDLASMSWRPLPDEATPLFCYGGVKLVDGMLMVAGSSGEKTPSYVAPAPVDVGGEAGGGRSRWPPWIGRAKPFAPLCIISAGRVLVLGGNALGQAKVEGRPVIDVTASPLTDREQDDFDNALAPPNALGAWAPVQADDMHVVRVGCAAGVSSAAFCGCHFVKIEQRK
eukprot:SAG31_NODE_533_length_14371_cov_6.455367_13_plen_253_part_00